MKVDAVVFDLFGTLLDISSLRHISETMVGKEKTEQLISQWRQKQIMYSWASTMMDRYLDFDTLTSLALDYALAASGTKLDAAKRKTLADGWLQLRPYPDSTLALEALRSRGMRTAVLTNGTRETAKRALAGCGLDALLNDVWSCDEIKIYKPSMKVYEIAVARLGLRPERIGFVSSNAWDATGAAAFGFHVIWCNRGGAPEETLPPPPAHVVSSLERLPEILES